MRRLSILATVVACGACQPLPDATVAAETAPPAPAEPACTSYTVPVTVGGQQQQASVEACQQPDGSWRITQNTPGLPPQVYEVPALAYSPYPVGYAYPDYSPYWWGSPWYFGPGYFGPGYFGLAPSIVVARRFNRFHHGFHRGFHHGFHRNFARGSGRGFGHRFAAARAGGMGGGRR